MYSTGRFKRLLKALVVLIVFCFSVSGVGFSAESVKNLKDRAKKLYWGIGGEQNYTKAFQLYLQAAEAGDAEGQYISGGMYLKGLGVGKDFGKAFKLLPHAAV